MHILEKCKQGRGFLAEGENIFVIADFMKERCWKTF